MRVFALLAVICSIVTADPIYYTFTGTVQNPTGEDYDGVIAAAGINAGMNVEYTIMVDYDITTHSFDDPIFEGWTGQANWMRPYQNYQVELISGNYIISDPSLVQYENYEFNGVYGNESKIYTLPYNLSLDGSPFYVSDYPEANFIANYTHSLLTAGNESFLLNNFANVGFGDNNHSILLSEAEIGDMFYIRETVGQSSLWSEVFVSNISNSWTPGVAAVPEPATFSLLLFGLIGLFSVRKKK